MLQDEAQMMLAASIFKIYKSAANCFSGMDLDFSEAQTVLFLSNFSFSPNKSC